MGHRDVVAAAARALFDAAAQAAVVLRADGDRLEILAVNDALCMLTGYPRDALDGRDPRDIQAPEVVAGFLRRLEQVRDTGQPVRYRVTRDVPAGRLTFEVLLVPVPDPDGGEPTVFAAVAEDVSEQVRTAQLFAETQQLANVGTWLWNVADDLVVWSEAMYRMFGVSEDDFHPTYEAFFTLVHAEDRDRVRSQIEATLRDKLPFEFEFRVQGPDGGVRTMTSRGHVVCAADGELLRLAGTTQDVTVARRAAEYARQLREAEASREQALELNDDVLQGLSAASLALDLGDHDRAREALDRTLAAVRTIIDELLAQGPPLQPGSLVRNSAAGAE